LPETLFVNTTCPDALDPARLLDTTPSSTPQQSTANTSLFINASGFGGHPRTLAHPSGTPRVLSQG
jgi:hypothetical protein